MKRAERQDAEVPVLGVLRDDPVSEMLGTDFKRFASQHGILGLARANGDTLVILAVVSERPGHGHFAKFLVDAMSRFKAIVVLEIWNDSFKRYLGRNGFSDVLWREPSGEQVDGMRWDA